MLEVGDCHINKKNFFSRIVLMLEDWLCWWGCYGEGILEDSLFLEHCYAGEMLEIEKSPCLNSGCVGTITVLDRVPFVGVIV